MTKLIPIVALSVIAFASGWYVSHVRETNIRQQAIIEMQEAFEAQRKRADEITKSLQGAINEADKRQENAERDIDSDYKQRVDRLRNDITAKSSTDMPNTTSTSCKVSASLSEHNARVRRAFRELRAELLTVARDRDITASHYNELISLYNSLLEQTNKRNSNNGE